MQTTDRIIDIASGPAKIKTDLERLVITRTDGPDTTVPLPEVAVLVGAHKAVAYTHSVFSGLARHGGVFIACDERRMPAAMMLPLTGHHRQSERFAQQAGAGKPVKKRAWQQVIKAKVSLQGRVLADFRGDDHGLAAMADRVRSGDPDNVEGQAARRYWPALFDDASFRRDHEAGGANILLNYGYAVLRAMTARAICAAGLHPSLGIHHHNRYDAFPLADDLMEPFRPLVDRAVLLHVSQYGMDAELDKEAKAALIGALLGRFEAHGELRSLADILGRMAASLAAVFAGERKALLLPDL